MTEKYLNFQEFIDCGYLQEANRQFFHPLGLALGVNFEDDGKVEVVIEDHRDDPEGLIFIPESFRDKAVVDKVRFIFMEWHKRKAVRMEKLGFMVQPIAIKKGATR